ncbi:MAG: hypothetical protein JWN96_3235 [Mycobacterium sp.]|nr:hypothetical protein [Mycobacterium sp.]
MARIKILTVLLLALLGASALAMPASASQSKSWTEAVPRDSYSVDAFTVSLSVPIAPCRSGRRGATVALAVSVTRCLPVGGCGFATTARRYCRGTSGFCTVTLRVPHGSVEAASYYVQSTATGFSGDEVSTTSTSSSGGAGCVSAAVTARC